jgi:protein O-GlcNAc transferase
MRLDPECARARAGYGATLAKMGHAAGAIEAYWESLRLESNQPRVYAALGRLYLERGCADHAVDCLRQAVALETDDEILHSNLLYALHLDVRAGAEEIFDEHLKFGRRLDSLAQPAPVRRSSRPIRIGYVSGDFCDHPVSINFAPIAEHHNRREFEITLYSSTPKPDAVTRRLRGLGRWRDVRAISDEQLAAMVRRDRIDILVDLAGHTSIARLGAFARRPAPIQVTYIGYPGTTGLSSIDYRITDRWADPPGATEQWHTETLVRLPGGFLCFREPDDSPPVRKSRLIGVTFGSFSKPAKWNAQVIETWAAILRRLPESRLLLHHGGASGAQVLESFLAHGVDPARIGITGFLDWRAHWRWFHQIDLALDPFPYNGTCASCETLWMGVPFITLAGRTHASRVGVSLLSRLRLESLIARDREEYIELAVALATDAAELDRMRSGMRRRMRRSTLMNARAFTRELEDAYRQMIRQRSTVG